MKKTNMALALLAAVQGIIVFFALQHHSSLADRAVADALLQFEQNQVDHIQLEDADKRKIELVRKDATWRTPDDFSADKFRIDRLLNKLGNLKVGLPVSHREADQSRFAVDSENFKGHILLKKGTDTLAELYIGNSTGASRAYVRSSDSPIIYSARIAEHDATAKLADWWDKNALQVKPESVQTVALADITLKQDVINGNSTWALQQPVSGKKLDQERFREALNRLLNLRFDSLVKKDQKIDWSQPILEVQLGLKNGSRQYQIVKVQDKKDENNIQYYLKVSNQTYRFKLADYIAEPLIEGLTEKKWLISDQQATTEENKSSSSSVQE